MRDRYTVRGPQYRAQLVVFDFTGPDTPPRARRKKPTFCVLCLPASANRNTAFSRGQKAYYGDDPAAALEALASLVPGWKVQMPDDLLRWMHRLTQPQGKPLIEILTEDPQTA